MPDARGKPISALRLVAVPSAGYVWPDVETQALDTTAPVSLLVAAGAVGKTAAAEAIAATLRWPLVDAAKAQVGSYSLSGLLHDALGFESNYMSEVASGRAGIVIDALDEAHLRAGTSNFQAFLENVCGLAGSGHGQTTIVLLSRPDTAEIVQLALEEYQAAYNVMRLQFFSYEQACAYLETHLESLAIKHPDREYAVTQKHPQSYSKLRDTRMAEIAQALKTEKVESAETVWRDVADFLGYAPVLSVLAEYLAVANPAKELTRPLQTGLRASKILLQIITSILEREQQKYLKQVEAKLRAALPAEQEWNNSSEIYSPAEQDVRLVSRLLDVPIAVSPPAQLPTCLRQPYEYHANQFIADHPFLSGDGAVNAIFGDYMVAKAAVDPHCQVSLNVNPARSITDVGPFFYQFVHEFAPREGAELEHPEVPDGIVPQILESYFKAQVDPERALFVYYQSGGSGHLLLATAGRASTESTLEFGITDVSGVAHFPRTLSRGAVVTDGGVVLGTDGQSFLLGPHVTVRCSELEIRADHLSVRGLTAGRGPVIPCSLHTSELSVVGQLSVETTDPGALQIYTSAEWPPLRPYIKSSTDRSSFIAYAAYVDLRAILRTFRQGGGKAPSVYGELLEQRIVKKNRTRQQFLETLLAEKIVYREGSSYYLNVAGLSARGINWHSITDGEPTPEVLQFLVELTSR